MSPGKSRDDRSAASHAGGSHRIGAHMSIAGGVLLSSIVSFYFVPPAFALAARLWSGRRAAAEVVTLEGEAMPDPAKGKVGLIAAAE